jgi:signal peptidase II
MSETPVNPSAPAPFGPWTRWFVPALLVVLVLDQVSKEWIFSFPDERGFPAWIARSYNTGVAWGLGNSMPLVVTLITALLIPVLVVVWWRQFRPLGPWENLAFGAVLGGALGNGIDRVLTQFGRLEGVRDFVMVDLRVVGIDYIWPTFNVADAGISCGVVLLVMLSLFKRPVDAPPKASALV